MGRASRKAVGHSALRERPEKLSAFALRRAIEEFQVPPSASVSVGEALLRLRDLVGQMEMSRDDIMWDKLLSSSEDAINLYQGRDLPAELRNMFLERAETAEEVETLLRSLQLAWNSFSPEERAEAEEWIGEAEYLRSIEKGREMWEERRLHLLDLRDHFVKRSEDQSLPHHERRSAERQAEQAERDRQSANPSAFVAESRSAAKRVPLFLGAEMDLRDYMQYGIHKDLLSGWEGDDEISIADAKRVMGTFDRIGAMENLPQIWDEDIYNDLVIAEKIFARLAPACRGGTLVTEGFDEEGPSLDDEEHCLALAAYTALLRGENLASVVSQYRSFA